MDIGDKLRRLRLQKGLTQEEMADRCELSKGFISQAERNITSPSIATLTDMLESLGSNLKDFFSESNEKTVFTAEDMFVKEDEEKLKGSLTWLVPSAQKNMMEPILVNLGPGGKTQTVLPYEGEEFGYVLSGSITLTNNGKSVKVRKGESFYLSNVSSHYIENRSQKTTASFIWVSAPPNF